MYDIQERELGLVCMLTSDYNSVVSLPDTRQGVKEGRLLRCLPELTGMYGVDFSSRNVSDLGQR